MLSIRKKDWLRSASRLLCVLWPCCGPASLTLYLPTLFGKRGIFTLYPWPWAFNPLSFCITMLLIPDFLVVTCLLLCTILLVKLTFLIMWRILHWSKNNFLRAETSQLRLLKTMFDFNCLYFSQYISHY